MTKELPAWRELTRELAHQATLDEAERRWGTRELPFNYRWEHVQAVVRLALRLADLVGADREIVEAAAWLHDVRKQGRDDDHGRDGATAARHILAGTDFPPAKIDAVAEAIAQHVGLFTDEPVEPLEAAVLWDADKLSKLGATAVLHFSGYQAVIKGGTAEQLLERLADQGWQPEAVRSFHTQPAQLAGQRRWDAYRQFWKRLARELDGDDLQEGDEPADR
jgi:uncharacterized protein